MTGLGKLRTGDDVSAAAGEYTGENATDITVADVRNVTLHGEASATKISCVAPYNFALQVQNVDGFNISGIAFEGCQQSGLLLVGSTVTLTQVTMTNNTAMSSNGGAVRLTHGSVLTVFDGVFEGNIAGANGGALALLGGSHLSVFDTRFDANSAGYGGAVYLEDYGSFELTRSTFWQNSATKGGAVYAKKADASSVVASEFHANTAAISGGALYLAAGGDVAKYVILWSNFTANTIDVDASVCYSACNIGGAALRMVNSTAEVADSRFENNGVRSTSSQTSYGGAIFSSYFKNEEDSNQQFGTQLLTRNTFLSNFVISAKYASGRGGGIAVQGQSMKLSHSMFHNNSAYATSLTAEETWSGGGGVFFSGGHTMVAQNVSFVANVVTGGYGGGFHVLAVASVAVRDCNFTRNTAVSSDLYSAKGGGLYVIGEDPTTLQVQNSTFVDNLVVPMLLYDSSGERVLTSTWGGYGGAVYSETVQATINASIFDSNAAFNGNYEAITGGGAIALVDDSFASIDNCTFLNNHAVGSMVYNPLYSQPGVGGALLLRHGDCEIRNSTFEGNLATASGGLNVPDTVVMMSGAGGAVALISSKNIGITILNTSFIQNYAFGAVCNGLTGLQSGSGGAVAVLDSSTGGTVLMKHILFSENVAVSGATGGDVYPPYPSWGGGLLYTQADLDILEVNFTRNVVLGGGFGMDMASLPVAETFRQSKVSIDHITFAVATKSEYDILNDRVHVVAKDTCVAIKERLDRSKSTSSGSTEGRRRTLQADVPEQAVHTAAQKEAAVVPSHELRHKWVHSAVSVEKEESARTFLNDDVVLLPDVKSTLPSSWSISGTVMDVRRVSFVGNVHIFFGDEQEFATLHTYFELDKSFKGTVVDIRQVDFSNDAAVHLSAMESNLTLGELPAQLADGFTHGNISVDQGILVNSNLLLRQTHLTFGSVRLCDVTVEDFSDDGNTSTLSVNDGAIGNRGLPGCVVSRLKVDRVQTTVHSDLYVASSRDQGDVTRIELTSGGSLEIQEGGALKAYGPTVVGDATGRLVNHGRILIGGIIDSNLPVRLNPEGRSFIPSITSTLVVESFFEQTATGVVEVLLNETQGTVMALASNQTFLGTMKIKLVPDVSLTLFAPDVPSAWQNLVVFNSTGKAPLGMTKQVIAPDELVFATSDKRTTITNPLKDFQTNVVTESLVLTQMGCRDINPYYAGLPTIAEYPDASQQQVSATCFYCLKNSACGMCPSGCANVHGQCPASTKTPSTSCCEDNCHNHGKCNEEGSVLDGSLSYSCACEILYTGANCQDFSSAYYAFITVPLAVLVGAVLVYYAWYKRKSLLRLMRTLKHGVLMGEYSPENAPFIEGLRQDFVLKDVLVDYRELLIVDKIGEGSFGSVFSAIHNGEKIALKKLRQPFMMELSEEQITDFKREAYLMTRLRHRNIVLVVGISISTPDMDIRQDDFDEQMGSKDKNVQSVCILTEFADQGALSDLLYGPNARQADEWSYELSVRLMLDAARGMLYLHTQTPAIIHRDLKCANLVVNNNWMVKVTDFGMSRIMPWEEEPVRASFSSPSMRRTSNAVRSPMASEFSMTSRLGTPRWTAPELYGSQNYTTAVDSFSFGIVMWEMFYRELPFSGITSHFDIYDAVEAGQRPPVSSDCPDEYRSLMVRCWDNDPAKRPRFQEIVHLLGVMLDDELDSNLVRTTSLQPSLGRSVNLLASPDGGGRTASVDMPGRRNRALSVVSPGDLRSPSSPGFRRIDADDHRISFAENAEADQRLL
jgi:predicted outer membrane repeat protein